MTLNPDTHDQLTAARRRDLLDAAGHHDGPAQAGQRSGVRSSRFTFQRPRLRRHAPLHQCFPGRTASR